MIRNKTTTRNTATGTAWRFSPVALCLLSQLASVSPTSASPVTTTVSASTLQDSHLIEHIQVVSSRLSSQANADIQVSAYIDSSAFLQFQRDNIGDALNLVSGTTLATNSRNEKMISVRGFDARQVPLFIDGVPLYVPYDGYVDFDRFTTADLAGIQLAKGFSSVLYGPNALGGAINLLSARPTAPFAADVAVKTGSAGLRQVSFNAGTLQDHWFAQTGFAQNQSDGFNLSDDFVPTATEDGGRRDNASSKDRKWSVKLGYQPNDSDEYMLSYHDQHGEKGQPPSTEPAAARYWRWPYWDKRSLYFLSSTVLTATETLKVRLFHDRFDNEVQSFTDARYRTLKTSGKGSVGSGRSIYDDQSAGLSLELTSLAFAGQQLRLVSQFKQDEHMEFDGNATRNSELTDQLLSVAAEDNLQINDAWLLSAGIGLHRLTPQTVFSFGNPYSLPDAQQALNTQAGLFYQANACRELYWTYAAKTRMPTLKDRYSQRLGTFLENPDLTAEQSDNYEFGIRQQLGRQVQLEGAVFFSAISDKIQTVANVSGVKSQMQNVGRTRASGFEAAITAALNNHWRLGSNYSLTQLQNRADPAVKLTDVPRHKTFSYLRWQLNSPLALQLTHEYNSSRWINNSRELAGFSLVGFSMQYDWQQLAFSAGVNNLLDKNYALADGFPAAGRMSFAKIHYQI